MNSAQTQPFFTLEKATPSKPELLLSTASFKREAWKVGGALLLFFLVYFLLFAGAIALAAGLGYMGFILVVSYPRLITIVIGLGMVVTGLLVIFFLIKFLFTSSKTDHSQMVEVKEAELPQLFHFIRAITEEVGAPFPKKIFLSPEVNASVFYNSSFWSMFFPVKKNLVIGLGLVNSISLREFQAVMAHEFGHFSQKSMRLGSYIYNVNRAIHNMLFDNEGYQNALNQLAQSGSWMGIFSILTTVIINGIQLILQKVYEIVNRQYRSLSRQMEFHADAVAVYVAGGKAISSSLKRIEFGDMAFNSLLSTYEKWASEKLFAANIYPQQSLMMKQISEDLGIKGPFAQNLPDPDSLAVLEKFHQEVKIEDQWASHPRLDQRAKHALSKGVSAPDDDRLAWELFPDAERWQIRLSEKLLSVPVDPDLKQLELDDFQEKIKEDKKKQEFPAIYHGYFNRRELPTFDSEQKEEQAEELADMLDDTLADLPLRMQVIEGDLESLHQIFDGRIKTKSFDFRGEKYSRDQAKSIEEVLKNEKSELDTTLRDLDLRIMNSVIINAKANGKLSELKELYREYEKMNEEAKSVGELIEKIMNELTPVFTGAIRDINHLENIFVGTADMERALKAEIRQLLKLPDLDELFGEEATKVLSAYESKNQLYVNIDEFNESDFHSLIVALQVVGGVNQVKLFRQKQKVLREQLIHAGISDN